MKEQLNSIRRGENGNGNGHTATEESHHQEVDLLIKDAIFVRHERGYRKVIFSDILWLKGDGNYTTMVTRDAVFSVRNILKDFEQVLPPQLFLRIHKSYMINVEEVSVITLRELQIGEDMIPIGRSFYHGFMDRVQKLSPSGD